MYFVLGTLNLSRLFYPLYLFHLRCILLINPSTFFLALLELLVKEDPR